MRLVGAGVAADPRREPGHGHPAELAGRLAHGGQARHDVAGGDHVVPADDGQVVRDEHAVLPQPTHHRERELVVGADQAVDLDAAAQDLLGHLDPGSLDQRHPQRRPAQRQPGRRVRVPEAGVPVGDVRRGLRVTDEHQVPPAVLEQVGGQPGRAGGVLGGHGVAPRHPCPAQRHHRPGAAQRLHDGVRDGALGDDQAVDVCRQVADRLRHVRAAPGDQQHHVLAQLRGRRLQTQHELGVVRAVQVGQHHAERLAPAVGHQPRASHRAVGQVTGGGQHPRVGLGGAGRRTPQHAGHGGGGDAGPAGDVVDGGGLADGTFGHAHPLTGRPLTAAPRDGLVAILTDIGRPKPPAGPRHGRAARGVGD